MLKEGDQAPGFEGPDDGNGRISLVHLKGQKIVLYFYPKDNTPGCTREACAFRDHFGSFHDKETAIIGVSPDSSHSHDKFKKKFNLPFSLLSDPDHKIALAYGVWKEKSMYGRKFMGIERSTFVIGRNGRIKSIHRKVRVNGHVEKVLETL